MLLPMASSIVLPVVVILALAVECASARRHKQAVCVTDRKYENPGGLGYSVSYKWTVTYQVLLNSTECACNYYKARNTGNNPWDSCPDCIYDGIACNSDGKHIGGTEMNYYCGELCDSEGAEADEG